MKISVYVVIVLLFTSCGGASKLQVNKLHCGAFQYNLDVKESSKDSTYLILKDGSKVIGKKITFKLFAAKQIQLDKVDYPVKEVPAYLNKGITYKLIEGTYVPRLITGKLNIYLDFESTSRGDGKGGFTTSEHCYHYIQKGEKGPIERLASLDDLKSHLASCPTAYQMVDKSTKDLRKAVRANPKYLNEAVELFNKSCK